jgi:hypothetical protein
MTAGAMLATGFGEGGGLGAWSGFGYSVALSADGTTALVGAPHRDGGAGAVLVFQSSSQGTWATSSTKVATLIDGGDFKDGAFGSSVALSADGTTALIGAPTENGHVGAVFVFHVNAETAWASSSAPTARLSVGGGASGDELGYSVALAADGRTALAGAWGVANGAGAAYVFHASSASTWSSTSTPEATLTANGSSGDNLGRAVALSGDGATALVGAPAAGGAGAAYVFSASSADAWTTSSPVATLTSGATTTGQWFGASTALSSDATTALIGAPGDSHTAGAAYIFRPSSPTTWETSASPLATLTNDQPAAGDGLGRSVSFSSDGATALVGGSEPSHILADGGEAAYVFTAPSEAGWTSSSAPATLAWNRDGIDDLGRSVSLSADGTTALVGAPLGGITNSGAADIFATLPANAGPPAKLAFTNGVPDGPGWWTDVGTNFTTWVSVEDASGGPAAGPYPSEISLAITAGTGNPDAQLHCGANPAPVIAGTAFFTCWIDKVGKGYTLTASGDGVAPALFPSFDNNATFTLTTVSSSLDPAKIGETVTFTSMTRSIGGKGSPTLIPPAGTVKFENLTTHAVLAGCDAVPISPSTGIATCTTQFPAAGQFAIFPTYSGTADFGPSTGGYTQTVVDPNPPPPPPPTKTLTISKAGTGSGTVSSQPAGISCGSSCAFSFAVGTQVALTAAAGPGSTFAGWSIAGCAGTGPCQVTVTDDTTITATFTVTAPAPSPHCVVPDVRRATLAAAKNTITAGKCGVGTITRANSKRIAKGSVISQSSRPGTRLKQGAKVGLVVSKG